MVDGHPTITTPAVQRIGGTIRTVAVTKLDDVRIVIASIGELGVVFRQYRLDPYSCLPSRVYARWWRDHR